MENTKISLIEIEENQIRMLSRRFQLPLHIIFLDRLEETASEFLRIAGQYYPKTIIGFAVKSNPCLGAVREIQRLGLGVDVVSEYELQIALEAGITSNKIICNGNAKSDYYISKSIELRTLIAIDSIEEIKILNEKARQIGKKARVLVRIAGMPLEGFTAANQSTASNWTKFGVALDEIADVFRLIKSLSNIDFEGISAHIGTQICDPTGYDRLLEHMLKLSKTAYEFGLNTKYLDIGGGFPVSFMSKHEWKHFTTQLRHQLNGKLSTNEWVTWNNLSMGYSYLQGRSPKETDSWVGKAYWSPYPGALMLERLLNKKGNEDKSVREELVAMGSPTLIVEPGRSMIGPAGVTITQVAGVKKVLGNHVVTLDLGINNHGTNLISPDIFPVEILPRRKEDNPLDAFLAGRLCFGSDMISMAKVKLNRLPKRGDLVVIHLTGAYCADHFASNSCGFPRPAKIAVSKDGTIEVWRSYEKFDDMLPHIEA